MQPAEKHFQLHITSGGTCLHRLLKVQIQPFRRSDLICCGKSFKQIIVRWLFDESELKLFFKRILNKPRLGNVTSPLTFFRLDSNDRPMVFKRIKMLVKKDHCLRLLFWRVRG
jgi:hypothetical protein